MKRRRFVGISKGRLLRLLYSLCYERLTSKQRLIINELYATKKMISATGFVLLEAEKLGCSRSTCWNAINQLKRTGIVNFGICNGERLPLSLTAPGFVIAKKLVEVRPA